MGDKSAFDSQNNNNNNQNLEKLESTEASGGRGESGKYEREREAGGEVEEAATMGERAVVRRSGSGGTTAVLKEREKNLPVCT